MNANEKKSSPLALLGGPKTIEKDPGDLFTWPIVTEEHEQAVLEVIRAGKMSGVDVTREFEKEYSSEIGMKYALACNNGTAAIHCGLYGLGVSAGDEVICPSLTYWASISQVYSLGATPVFAEVDRDTLCLDPDDFARRITPKTKVVVVVHYAGVPADMDRIMDIARRHKIKVFEDGSHAHAALYKGKQVGTFGDASGFSLMSGKSFAVGEGGILFTNDQEVYERAALFGHYERHGELELEHVKEFGGIPCGGYKYRMHQASSAFGRVQLKVYRAMFEEIDRAMNRYCDLIDAIPGIQAHRPEAGSGSTKGGWYFPLAHYDREQFGGLSVKRFCDALNAEGSTGGPGCNKPLHPHPLFNSMDVYGHGQPTRMAMAGEQRDNLVQPEGSLPVTESINARIMALPWFKHDRPEDIEQYAAAMRKVAENYEDLLPEDKAEETVGGYSSTFRGR